MSWKLPDGTEVARPREVTINGVTYPKQIFSKPEECEALGITKFDPPSTTFDNRFYWAVGIPRELEDRAETNEDGTPMLNEKGEQVITKGLKSNAIAVVKRQAGGILSRTDWQVVKAAETGTAISTELATYRASVRTKSNEIEAAITGCTTLEAYMALHDVPVDAEGIPTGNAPIVDWPEA